jgi:hypothetical protein
MKSSGCLISELTGSLIGYTRRYFWLKELKFLLDGKDFTIGFIVENVLYPSTKRGVVMRVFLRSSFLILLFLSIS